MLHRHHADLHYRALQIVQHPGLESHGVGKLSAQQFFRIGLRELVQRLLQHGFSDNQFAYQVEHAIDAACVHSQNIFQSGRGSVRLFCRSGARRRKLCRLGLRHGTIDVGGWSVRHWSGRKDQFHRDFFRDGGNLALRRDLLSGLYAGQHELHLLGGCRRFGVGPHRQDLPRTGNRIVDQLAAGNRHGAVRIDLGHYLIHSQSAGLGPRHGCILVFRPKC